MQKPEKIPTPPVDLSIPPPADDPPSSLVCELHSGEIVMKVELRIHPNPKCYIYEAVVIMPGGSEYFTGVDLVAAARTVRAIPKTYKELAVHAVTLDAMANLLGSLATTQPL